jgi:hypothetical protein
MTRRIERDLKRLWAEVAEQNSARLADVRLTNGGHVRGVFVKDGARVFVVAASSPRSSCTDVIAAQARRVLRGLAP